MSLALVLIVVLARFAAPAAEPSARGAGTSARVAAMPDSVAMPDSTAIPDSTAVPDSTAAPTTPARERLRVVATIADANTGPGQVIEPAGVACDAFGRIYVTDAAQHRLQRYDAHGAWLGESGSLGSGAGLMRRPGALATLGTLSIAVLDEENRRVLSYDLFGRLLGTLIDLLDPTLEGTLGRVDPVALAADQGGAVYVTDADRDRLLVFDFSGRYVRTLGGYGARPGSFEGLSGVAVGRRGDLVTTERANARVQRLDPNGRVQTWWALPVAAASGALPVAVDDSSNVAVADQASGRLWVFDPGGHVRATLDGLRGPRALAFARDRTLLVAEAGAGRVRRMRLEPIPEGPARRED